MTDDENAGLRDYVIPLPGGKRRIYLQTPLPLTEEDWQYVSHLLSVAKPGIVYEPSPAPDPAVPLKEKP